MNQFFEVDPSVFLAIEEYKKVHNLGSKKMARLIGLPEQTFRCIMKKRGPVLERNKTLLEEFVKNPKDPSILTDNKLPRLGIIGNEKSLIPDNRMQILLSQGKMGMDLLLPVLKEFANSEVGSRKVFHKFFKGPFQDLYTLTRALTSESMLSSVQKDLGKTTLP